MKTSSRLIVTVCAVATGIWGISHVAAFQDALVDEAAPTVANQEAEQRSGDATAPASTSPNKSRQNDTAAPINFSRRWKREREQRLNEMMDSNLVRNLSFPGDNPLSVILERLSQDLSKTQRDLVCFVPDTPALDSEGIASLQDVIIKDIELDNVPAGAALDLVLRQTDPPLTWRIVEGFLYITTRFIADETLFLRSYDITKLRLISKFTVPVSEATNVQHGGMGGGMFQLDGSKGAGVQGGGIGAGRQVQQIKSQTLGTGNVAVNGKMAGSWEESLIMILQDMTSPPSRWFNHDGEGGRMNLAENRLLVLQTRTGHQMVIDVLEQLELGADDVIGHSPPVHPANSTGASEFSRRSSQDTETELNQIIQATPIPELAFPGEHPLQEILKQIESHLLGLQAKPVLMMTDSAALDEESIDSLEDVIIRDIQIPAGAMTVGSALDRILTQTDPSLTWIAKDEVLLITTQNSADADEHVALRSYDISGLRKIMKQPASGWTAVSHGSFFAGGMGGGGLGGGSTGQNQPTSPSTPQASHPAPATPSDKPIPFDDASLLIIVQNLTAPPARWFDIDGEGGRMDVAGNRLLVRQSRSAHQAIVEVLQHLEMAAEAEGSED